MDDELYLPKPYGDRKQNRKIKFYDAVNEKASFLKQHYCKRHLNKALIKLKSMYILDRVLKHPDFVMKSKMNERDFKLLLQQDDDFFKFVLPQLHEMKEKQIIKMQEQINQLEAKEKSIEFVKSEKEEKLNRLNIHIENYKKTIKEYNTENAELKQQNRYLFEKLQEKVEEIEILRNKLNIIEEQI